MIIPRPDDILKVTRDYMTSPDLNVDLMCRELNISRPTLHKYTKKYFNVTPSRMIFNLKMFRVFKLVYDFRKGIYDSAKEMGYLNSNAFAKIIRREFGKSPGQIEHELANLDDYSRKAWFMDYHVGFLMEGMII